VQKGFLCFAKLMFSKVYITQLIQVIGPALYIFDFLADLITQFKVFNGDIVLPQFLKYRTYVVEGNRHF